MSFFAGTVAESRDYQERICTKALSMLDGTWVSRSGHRPPAARSVLIESPTGSGKTVMALALGQWAASQGKRVGFVAMRRNLLTQTAEMLDRLRFTIPNMRFISMFENRPPTDVDWLIVDESQHDSTDSMAHIHATVQPEKVIGLSATPYRSDRAQLAFERTIRDAGINALIQEGWLSEFDHYTVQRYSPESIADLIVRERAKWGKSVAFFLRKDECDRAAELLSRAGVPNEVVWGGSDRESQIEAFRAGTAETAPVLISMSILSEGFDADDMQTVFIRPSSKLPTVQMGGRVLRKNPDVPRKQIVQCMDTNYPFVRMARPRTAWVQVGDEFRSLTHNDRIDEIAREFAERVVMSEVVLPDFIAKRKPGTIVPVESVVAEEQAAAATTRRRSRRAAARRSRRS